MALPKLGLRRNTSTDVEKTKSLHWFRTFLRKHLHGRGEDPSKNRASISGRETPPRTWRKRIELFCLSPHARNTSTDVEKTRAAIPTADVKGKHLHGRGEDCIVNGCCADQLETPPRTWRRHFVKHLALLFRRNTSTDVEKTPEQSRVDRRSQKHLHGRGEDVPIFPLPTDGSETPPRTWRRRFRRP